VADIILELQLVVAQMRDMCPLGCDTVAVALNWHYTNWHYTIYLFVFAEPYRNSAKIDYTFLSFSTLRIICAKNASIITPNTTKLFICNFQIIWLIELNILTLLVISQN